MLDAEMHHLPFLRRNLLTQLLGRSDDDKSPSAGSHFRDCLSWRVKVAPKEAHIQYCQMKKVQKLSHFYSKRDCYDQPCLTPEIPASVEALVTACSATSTCLQDTFFPPPFHTLTSFSTFDSQRI